MKRIMVLLGLGTLCVAGSLHAEMPRDLTSITSIAPTVIWHDDLESGWKESRRRNVPMVIFITSDNCTYCDAMKRDTWCDGSVGQRISQGFVAIRLNPRTNATTLNRIKVKMYPTTLIGIPRGKVISNRQGYQPPAAIHQLLSEATSRIGSLK